MAIFSGRHLPISSWSYTTRPDVDDVNTINSSNTSILTKDSSELQHCNSSAVGIFYKEAVVLSTENGHRAFRNDIKKGSGCKD